MYVLTAALQGARAAVCLDTTVCVDAYEYYICVLILLKSKVARSGCLIILVCVHTCSSIVQYYMCVLIQLYSKVLVGAYALILLYVCAHTSTICVSSYLYIARCCWARMP